ncbi:unnamed protein product [Chondrus crispus]|uniref:Uncharacterized protein n=1 Tax=Chondrus crispus TaxID=2769 RepID=R7QHI3_CHOCR|nr:unnamed protein product [Chondrus crispus]CDF36890.1 unnamed protein product [Chondrus crispus]|eukprot:XP_005716709.1 unnamed protein product [Chondrus crispus]
MALGPGVGGGWGDACEQARDSCEGRTGDGVVSWREGGERLRLWVAKRNLSIVLYDLEDSRIKRPVTIAIPAAASKLPRDACIPTVTLFPAQPFLTFQHRRHRLLRYASPTRVLLNLPPRPP